MAKVRKLDGIIFYQAELEFLKLHFREYSTSLTAASLVTYLLLRSKCDEEGLIREDDFILKHLTEKYDLPYSSINKGLIKLEELGFVSRVSVNHKLYIQLPLVSRFAVKDDPRKSAELNYFRIPYYIFENGYLNAFIKARDVSGIVGLLDIINALYRDYSNKSQSIIKRKIQPLLLKMKKSLRSGKDWLKRLINNGKGLIKEVNFEQRDTFGNSVVELRFNSDAFNEREVNPIEEAITAIARKEIRKHFKNSSIQYKNSELTNCINIFKSDVLTHLHKLPNVVANDMALHITKNLLVDVLPKTVYAIEHSKTRNLPGLFRVRLKGYLNDFVKTDEHTKTMIRFAYQKTNAEIPPLFT
ncbi:hypothetical protein [Lysinibacillus fusiformis]|uniref:hypothetical protein n=1 Tax=Lysinibacillus fusiformis TaxID=28031 RepID=UPI0008880D0F|nr:hypothetical protein [Lysinibacillus fusiformis]SCX63120.1 hypothetical protein SAMN02787108_03180 [Lysinibacillus fusiformis]SDB45630.1 hypothetical protein SAMN02787070_03375 [Lysinibacillus fusiformis]SFI70885.1 hypothetical protein SAMN02787080_03393 [Lysinibacillus fusiformis]SFT14740.1 hypothetical protein SAMN02787099_03095 [Lysinibacillus fusiformis]